MKRKIYVSYFFKINDQYGISNSIISVKGIKNINDIKQIENIIAQSRNTTEVRLISWQSF